MGAAPTTWRSANLTISQASSIVDIDTPPMEARIAQALPTGHGWQYEPKWDGFRCLAFKSESLVDLRAKSGKPLGRYFPEIVRALGNVKAVDFVVDGEIVIELEGRLAFDALQMRLHPAQSRTVKLSTETPARLVLFDMLVDSKSLTIVGKSLLARRRHLEAFFKSLEPTERIILSPYTSDIVQAGDWLSQSGEGAIDGVIAKLIDAPYEAGKRAMIKVKRLQTADCVVGGFRYESDSALVGSLLLGLYNDLGQLDHVGFTSTISDEERPELTTRLESLRQEPGFTGKAPGGPSRWSNKRSSEWEPLRSELVAEVRFDQVTGRRFRHGTKLLRWRPDKLPAQCTLDQIERPRDPSTVSVVLRPRRAVFRLPRMPRA
jgi:ATP-dependent DNA ligase